ncbi:hypothetical protein HC031_20185 [Planosporangium thailandense]|uniref:Adhesin n=1 Tax=Planosporangium thailandense TaxID=765197 RepID=A0ABX0Y0Z9_9ACTN|nr:hypothetical protein [Planosporangium thailandense]NJC72017.1 hypothetical protein [Planosporangium thailandense]
MPTELRLVRPFVMPVVPMDHPAEDDPAYGAPDARSADDNGPVPAPPARAPLSAAPPPAAPPPAAPPPALPVSGGGDGDGAPAFPVAGRSPRRRRVAVPLAVGVAAAVAAAGVGIVSLRSSHSDAPIARTAERTDPTAGGADKPASAPTSAAKAAAGGSGRSPAPSAPRSSGSARSVGPAAASYTAVAGQSCPQAAGTGFYQKGWSADWRSRPTGGWSGDGCAGQVVAVPMSGDANQDDPDNVVVWSFRTGTVNRGSCAVRVHVPGTGDPTDAAGKPAHYVVYGSVDVGGTAAGSFDVDQTVNQGRWVEAGSFPVTTGQLAVQMVTRGVDWGPGRDGAHLGVSALRVDCRADNGPR